MTDADGPAPDDWAEAARECVADALVLARGKRWRNAYMLAGQALEHALKGRIMRHQGLNRWPSRKERPEFYSHDLSQLARLAGVHERLERAAEAGQPIGLAWMIAKDFGINRRYPDGQSFPMRLGRDMVSSAGGPGRLVTWLNGRETSTN